MYTSRSRSAVVLRHSVGSKRAVAPGIAVIADALAAIAGRAAEKARAAALPVHAREAVAATVALFGARAADGRAASRRIGPYRQTDEIRAAAPGRETSRPDGATLHGRIVDRPRSVGDRVGSARRFFRGVRHVGGGGAIIRLGCVDRDDAGVARTRDGWERFGDSPYRGFRKTRDSDVTRDVKGLLVLRERDEGTLA